MRILQPRKSWVSHSGVTFVYEWPRWTPFKSLHDKLALYLMDHLIAVTTYHTDKEGGSIADIKEKVWEKP